MDNNNQPASRKAVWDQNHAIRQYLEALNPSRSKPGRRRSPEKMRQRLATVEQMAKDAATLKKMDLLQEAAKLKADLSQTHAQPDMATLEAEFVKHAKAYADRKGISRGVWSKMSVSRDMQRRAGLIS